MHLGFEIFFWNTLFNTFRPSSLTFWYPKGPSFLSRLTVYFYPWPFTLAQDCRLLDGPSTLWTVHFQPWLILSIFHWSTANSWTKNLINYQMLWNKIIWTCIMVKVSSPNTLILALKLSFVPYNMTHIKWFSKIYFFHPWPTRSSFR